MYSKRLLMASMSIFKEKVQHLLRLQARLQCLMKLK